MARLAARRGLDPVVVAMGRGGPPEPQVAEAGSIDLERLVELVRAGEHAASDYLEDALTTGVTTIGARRAGGGLAGEPFVTNVPEAAALAAERDPGLADPGGQRIRRAADPMGCRDPGRAGQRTRPNTWAATSVRTGCCGRTSPLLPWLSAQTGSENLPALRSHILRYLDDARLLVTDFIPVPLADVQGARAFFATTAPGGVAARQVEHLEATHGCTVVGWSARLADRAGLAEDLDAAQGYDVLLTELKAAAVDIGVERALARGRRSYSWTTGRSSWRDRPISTRRWGTSWNWRERAEANGEQPQHG